MTRAAAKPHLSLWRIVQMNLGFLGLQFSFGLQQGTVGPIYSYLGAHEDKLPLLQLAGPMTGLIIQPIIGAMSDRTLSRWGRRTPYFVIGALMCSVGLLAMPFSQSLTMAVSLLWLLDAGNNITMEPYRAYVSDRLSPDQHQVGFLMQSAFTGLAQMLAFLAPSVLVYGLGMNKDAVDAHHIPYITHVAFMIGAGLSISTILWSVIKVPELPLSIAEEAAIRKTPKTVVSTLAEIRDAIVEIPRPMRSLAWMSLFQWYGMAAYWGYVIYAIGRTVFQTADPTSAAFREAVLANGQMAAFYNFVAFVSAFAMSPMTKRWGPKLMHALCLTFAGVAMIALTQVHDRLWLFLPAVGIGIGWASIMGNPYVILAGCIPPTRTGVYMGIFNMMIVIPMLLIAVTLPLIYNTVLNGDPRNVLKLSGGLLICAAIAVSRVKPETLSDCPPEARKLA